MNKLMTELGLDHDTVLIHRLHGSDDKAMGASLFTGKLELMHLNIKVLVATIKYSGSGIYNKNVHDVYYQGIPDSPEDFVQVLGRGGRHTSSNQVQGHFVLVPTTFLSFLIYYDFLE